MGRATDDGLSDLSAQIVPNQSVHHHQMEYRTPRTVAALKTSVAIPATSMLNIPLG